MPAQQPRLSRTLEGLHFAGDHLTYRITGLTNYNLERLRVTLKAFPADKLGQFHIDTLDLYHSRARESFAESCAKYLTVEQQLVISGLSVLIAELETERISMRENNTSAPVVEMTDAQRTEALKALKDKGLLKRILDDFNAIGFVGENNNKLLGYITAISRFLPDPLAMMILSRPGAGKTMLQNTVCKFIPEEHCIQYTRLTGQSLFYHAQDQLKNKVLAIEEEEGMQEAIYSIKTLITSQHLSVSTTRTDPATGKMSSDMYKVEGPVVVFVSTTKPDCISDEVKRRFLILTINETPEQTKNILYPICALMKNPAYDIRFNKYKKRSLPHVPGEAAVKQCLDDLHYATENKLEFTRLRDCALIELAYGSGLRRGELAVLDIEDIDVEILQAYVRGKGGKERKVPLTTASVDALRCYLAHRKATCGPLFISARR